MPDLDETIRRLSASFADEVIRALRHLPLEELMALTGGGDRVGSKAPAPARPRRARAKSSPARSTNGTADARALPDPSAIEAAERVFAERGSRGATAAQLVDALAAQGVVAPDGAEIIRVLVERESIRDAGFRRTTGQGTAPVFVSTK